MLRFVAVPNILLLYQTGCPNIVEAFIREQHKVHTRIYVEYHSVCPLVGIGTLPPPLSPASLPLPPEPKGGSTLACGWGVGGVRLLEKKLSALPTLWGTPFPFQRHLVGFWCIVFPLEPQARGGESCVGLFYCEYSKLDRIGKYLRQVQEGCIRWQLVVDGQDGLVADRQSHGCYLRLRLRCLSHCFVWFSCSSMELAALGALVGVL